MNLNKFLNWSIALPLFGVIVFSLSACDDNMFQGPAAIQRDGAELILATCIDIEVGSVLIERADAGSGTPIENLLVASGRKLLLAGTESTVQQLASGLEVSTLVEVPLSPGDYLGVQILPANPADQQISAAFTIKDEGLSDTLWLHPDGRETVEPCP